MIKPFETKYDYYLAGPFFNEQQLMQQDFIEMSFNIGGKTCFSPRKDAGTLPEKPTKKDMYDVFMNDIEAIKQSKILFANISYKDTGTCVEIGYALALGIPVILFWDKDNNDSGKVNLMLAMACNGNVIQSKEELIHYIYAGELPDNNFKFNVE